MQKINEILESLETGVRDFYSSDRFITYLNVMSKFHSYSYRNCMLIASQMPDATRVCGYKKWNEFGRHVKSGEAAITIIAPYEIFHDVDTGRVDENGNAIYEKRSRLAFKPVSVFDVSQTEGEALPELVSPLTGDNAEYEAMMKVLSDITPFKVMFGDPGKNANGSCNASLKTITIREGMSENQTIKTLIHEIAHERLHANLTDDDKENGYDRTRREIEAESTAYTVCRHFGLDTSEYSFGYVAAWASGCDDEVLLKSMETVKKEVKAFIDKIEKGLENEKKKTVSKETEVTEVCREALLENGINADVTGCISTGTGRAVPGEIKLDAVSVFNGYHQTFIIQYSTHGQIKEAIETGTSGYLNEILDSNGISYLVADPQPEPDMRIDLDTAELTDITGEKTRETYTVTVNGITEDEAFNVFSKLEGNGSTVTDISAVNPEEQQTFPYTEKLNRYEEQGLDDSWPMVRILYSSVKSDSKGNAVLREMDLNEAVGFIAGLDEEAVSGNDFIRMSISYTKEDYRHEHLELIDLGEARGSFIDYLHLPPSHIEYLNRHNNCLGYMKEACNYAPDTAYGREFSDNVLEWAQYCRMELNHSSEPVLPSKPALSDEKFQSREFAYWNER